MPVAQRRRPTDAGFLGTRVVTILFLWAALGAQSSEERLATHLRFLAADELQGRRVGEPGNQVAARYIAEQFRALGLEPPPGHDDYLMQLPLVSVEPGRDGAIVVGDWTLRQGEDFVILEGHAPAARFPAAAAAVSPGVAMAENSLRGSVAIAPLRGLRESLGTLDERRRRAAGAGAVALLDVYSGGGWETVRRFLERPRLQTADEVGEPVLHVLVNDPDGRLLDAVRAPGLEVSLRLEAPKRIPLDAHNVGALVPGNDPGSADEYVLLTAHFDHIGAGLDLPGATPEDMIFNGARDNGMGVVALLAAAEELAARPAARSVLLLAVNAEEQGLIGSRHYTTRPAVPLENTVFVLNTDSGGFTDTKAVTLIGTGRTTADPIVESACRDLGLAVLPDPAGANLFARSDNVSFARLGIPALTFGPGMHRFDPQSMPHYHQPSDEAGPDFDYAYLAAFARAFAGTARKLADSPQRIRWNEDQPYAEAARRLYGDRY